jgi:DNA polymerase III epsilon subunit family exonuclease
VKLQKENSENYCANELGIKNARGETAKKIMDVAPPVSIEEMMEMPLAKGRFLVVDLETSGMKPDTAQIIEIGAVEVNGFKQGKELSSLINPDKEISPRITKLTGIEEWMLYLAPKVDEVIPVFKNMLKNRILVAHNLKFDQAFLKKAWRQTLDETLRTKGLCTVKLSRRAYPELTSHNLDSLSGFLKIRPEKDGIKSRHRALGDAKMTARALIKMLRKLENEGVGSIEELLVLQDSRKRKK